MVCEWFDLKTTRTVFTGLDSKPAATFCECLASKSLGWLSSIWPQNQCRRFLAVWPQNLLQQFLTVWAQNLLRRFSPIWPQNWWRRFLPVWPQNRRSVSWLSFKTKMVEGFLVWASKPSEIRFIGCIRGKLKMNESMRRVTSDPATLLLSFLIYYDI
jgi:hypothetical protein